MDQGIEPVAGVGSASTDGGESQESEDPRGRLGRGKKGAASGKRDDHWDTQDLLVPDGGELQR